MARTALRTDARPATAAADHARPSKKGLWAARSLWSQGRALFQPLVQPPSDSKQIEARAVGVKERHSKKVLDEI